MLSNDVLKQLQRMGIGQAPRRKDFLVLTFSQFILLHRCVMAWPQSHESTDPEMVGLLERKLVTQVPQSKNRYMPTEAGVLHILPERLRKDPATASWPDKVPLVPH